MDSGVKGRNSRLYWITYYCFSEDRDVMHMLKTLVSPDSFQMRWMKRGKHLYDDMYGNPQHAWSKTTLDEVLAVSDPCLYDVIVEDIFEYLEEFYYPALEGDEWECLPTTST